MYTLTIKLLSDVSFKPAATAIKGYVSDTPCDFLGIPYIPALEIIGGRTLPSPDAQISHGHPDGYFALLQAANRLNSIVKGSVVHIASFFTNELYDGKNSSRRRCLKAGQIFFANLNFPKEKFEQMEAFFKEIRHIGIRTENIAGDVECSLKITTDKSATKLSEFPNYYALDYTLSIISPLSIPIPYDREPHTFLYAPGGLIRREICDKVVPNANLTVSNAYIAAKGERLLPMPLSMAIIKLSPEEMRYRLASDKRPNETEQLITVSNAYTRDFEESTAHYTVPDTTRIVDDNDNVYDALSSGQTLKGVIYGNNEDLRKLAEYIENHEFIMLGPLTDKGYGKVRLKLQELREKKPPAEILAKEFDAICLSDTVILNDEGIPAYNADVLKTEIERKLNAPNSLEIVGKYTDAQKDFDLYNGFAGSGVIRRALKAGSVVRFSVKDDKTINISPILHTFIGEKTASGYGEIATYPARGGYYRFAKRMEPDKKPSGDLSARELSIGVKLICHVLNEILKKRVKFLAFIDKEYYNENKDAKELLPTFVLEFLKDKYNPYLPLTTMNKWYLEELEKNSYEDFD